MMNKNILFTILIIVFFSCGKQEKNCTKTNYVLGGAKDNCLVYKSFNPAIELIGKTPGHFDTLNIDINNDNKNDIQIQCYDTIGAYIQPIVTKTNRIELNVTNLQSFFMSSNSPSYTYYGNIIKYSFHDTINAKSEWSPSNLFSNINILPYISNGSYFMTKSLGPIDTWHNAVHQYMGFRFIDGVDTLYGWVGISVIGYSHIIVHDCAYQINDVWK